MISLIFFIIGLAFGLVFGSLGFGVILNMAARRKPAAFLETFDFTAESAAAAFNEESDHE